MSAAGSFGTNFWMAKIKRTDPTPTTVAVQFQSPMSDTTDHNFSKLLPSPPFTPNTLLNCPMMIWIDMPVMKPAITALEMKLATHPIRTSPATRNTTPAVSANAAVIEVAVS